MAASGTGVTLSPRARWLTLVAMTIANSMILVDQTAVPLATPDAVSGLGASLSSGQWILTANVLPLAALMVFGGRLGDQLGLRRIFLIGTALFTVSSFLAGAAPTFPFLIVMRLTQGVGAAMMMPTTMAIVSFVFPEKQRGRALGIMAGASAFFAALGPVLGGLITQFIDWRAVFWINVPLAIITGLITVACAPDIEPNASADRRIDYPGVFTFAIGIGLITFGLGQATAWGWASAATIGTVLVGVMSLVTFVFVERRSTAPLMQLRLFRHLNFTAANISQVLAGSVELATAFLLPYFLLLVVGLSPGAAGIALIPMTIPIIVVAPLAGRWFDRVGGRTPLVVGFGVLAVSGLTLAYGAGAESAAALIPGLVLQGIGLGIVLTVNDPTGINAVPEDARGQASGVIDTSEQFGGALGIAVLTALFLQFMLHRFYDTMADHGIHATSEQVARGQDVVMQAEQKGFEHIKLPPFFGDVVNEWKDAHVAGYRFVFVLCALIAIVGAVASFFLVRREDRTVAGAQHHIFSRRSRWAWATTGVGPGISRQPMPTPPGTAPEPPPDGGGATSRAGDGDP